jgi:hypothetical protein
VCCGCSANDDVPAPLISTVLPNHAPPGGLVAVDGSYFCQKPNRGSEDPTCPISGNVQFGTSPGTPTTWTDTSIMVEVPQGVSGGVGVSVTAGGRTSNVVGFTVD